MKLPPSRQIYARFSNRLRRVRLAVARLRSALFWPLISRAAFGQCPGMDKGVIALAADHAGFELKAALKAQLEAQGREVLDLGAFGPDSVDYPDFADALARALAEGRAKWGLAVCGTGIGISMALNRHRHVRAALCHDATSARLAREHNNANVLALGARLIGAEVAKECLQTFLGTGFAGGRHERRVAKLA
jgi:ribose 5-phosphate isomerase B